MESRDQELIWVELNDLLEATPFPPRRDEKPGEELTSSIRIHGVLSPLLVRSTESGPQLVCGYRRLHAAHAAGLTRVPCLLATLEDSEAIRCYLSENNCRRDLDERQLEDVLDRLKRLRDGAEVEPSTQEPLSRALETADQPVRTEPTLVLGSDEVSRISERLSPGEAAEDSGVEISAEAPRPDQDEDDDEVADGGESAENRSLARWEIEDLVDSTRTFFSRVKETRRVDVDVALAIVRELIGIQERSRPLLAQDVYQGDKTSWLAPHSVLVASLNLALAPEDALDEEKRIYALAGLLHDIGMVFYADKEFIASPRDLNLHQRAELRRHTWLGHALLSDLDPVYDEVILAARDHHERADGGGYPQGLRSEELSPVARVTGIADVYGALIGPRPYRSCLSPLEALECLARNYGFSGDDAELIARLGRLYRDLSEPSEEAAPPAVSSPAAGASRSRLIEVVTGPETSPSASTLTTG